MDEGFVAKLLDVGSEVTYAEGTVLREPGDAPRGLLLLLHGTVEIEDAHGTRELGAGNVVDDAELEHATVVATSDLRAIAIDRASYEAALSG